MRRDAAPVSARIAALESSLAALIARVRRVGGYATPEEQEALWLAARVLAGEAQTSDSDLDDSDVPVDLTDDHEPPSDTAWRSAPPTVDEVRRWPLWWVRQPCCAPELMTLRVEGGRLVNADGWDPLGVDGQESYAPCVPPSVQPPPAGAPENRSQRPGGEFNPAGGASGRSESPEAASGRSVAGVDPAECRRLATELLEDAQKTYGAVWNAWTNRAVNNMRVAAARLETAAEAVDRLSTERDAANAKTTTVCVWLVDNVVHRARFAVAALERVSPPADGGVA